MSHENTDNTIRTGSDRTSVGLECPPETRTKQEFRDECDINNVVAHHHVTGQFSHVATVMPAYGDFSNITDYQEACNQIKAAELSFAQLPAAVRKRMDNDPAVFIEFLDDPDNQAEAEKLGLVEPPPKSEKELELEKPPAETPRESVPVTGGE